MIPTGHRVFREMQLSHTLDYCISMQSSEGHQLFLYFSYSWELSAHCTSQQQSSTHLHIAFRSVWYNRCTVDAAIQKTVAHYENKTSSHFRRKNIWGFIYMKRKTSNQLLALFFQWVLFITLCLFPIVLPCAYCFSPKVTAASENLLNYNNQFKWANTNVSKMVWLQRKNILSTIKISRFSQIKTNAIHVSRAWLCKSPARIITICNL